MAKCVVACSMWLGEKLLFPIQSYSKIATKNDDFIHQLDAVSFLAVYGKQAMQYFFVFVNEKLSTRLSCQLSEIKTRLDFFFHHPLSHTHTHTPQR